MKIGTGKLCISITIMTCHNMCPIIVILAMCKLWIRLAKNRQVCRANENEINKDAANCCC